MTKKELKEKAKEYAKTHALFYMSTKDKKIVTSAKEVEHGYRTGFNAGYSDGYEAGKKNERELQCGKNFLERLVKENKALREKIYEVGCYCKAVDKVNEKLKCCQNCKHWKWQDGDDLSKNSGVYYCESKLGGNELFSGKCDGWEIYE